MDPALDTLSASRKLEESGMPRPQAEAAVEVVNDAMRKLVTKKHFTAELDRRFAKVDQRFTKLESKMDQRFAKVDQRFTELEAKNETAFANLGKSQARGFSYLAGLIITAAALLFAALQYFGPAATVAAPAWDPPPNSAPSAAGSRQFLPLPV